MPPESRILTKHPTTFGWQILSARSQRALVPATVDTEIKVWHFIKSLRRPFYTFTRVTEPKFGTLLGASTNVAGPKQEMTMLNVFW